jgi:hypothetical protein
MHELFDDIVPHPEGVDPSDLIHERSYVVRAYRKGEHSFLLRGGVRDQKPPGLYIPGDDAYLTVHHMIVDLEISIPALEIIAARVVMETYPREECPRIEDAYQGLVGLSIARGFTHKVRELFGGPRGCTHTTALLQAMAPVAVQTTWSLRLMAVRAGTEPVDVDPGTPAGRERLIRRNIGSCHVWADDGEVVRQVREGAAHEVPVWIRKRYAELGLDPETWYSAG